MPRKRPEHLEQTVRGWHARGAEPVPVHRDPSMDGDDWEPELLRRETYGGLGSLLSDWRISVDAECNLRRLHSNRFTDPM